MGALLERRPEVDEDVGADDQVEIVERHVGDQVVLGKGDVVKQVALQPRHAPARGEERRQARVAAGTQVVVFV